jgi:hypothetical protein
VALPGAGAFVDAALAVLRDGQRVQAGADVVIGDRVEGGGRVTIVVPPADPALLGQVNRAMAAGGGVSGGGGAGRHWRFGSTGTPGPVEGPAVQGIAGVQVTRRYRIETGTGGAETDSSVLATVNGEPWLVRDGGGGGTLLLLGSRLDTAWTALPATPGFVPFVDALVNRLARGEAPVAELEGAPRVEFRTRGADTTGATVYGLDPRESDLTAASAALVRDVLGAEVLDGTALAAASFVGAGRRDLSGLLLTLALILAVVELGVATRTH